MSKTPPENIESKILDFLRQTGTPNFPSQIAASIHEPREDTLQGIERLIKHRRLKSVQDLLLLRITGETRAYGLGLA